MEMTPAAEIEATLDVLRRDGWYQGYSHNAGRTGRCWLGARAVAYGEQMKGCGDSSAYSAFRGAAMRLFPDRVLDKTIAIAEFNDHPDTTFEDIELVAKHAINDLELGEV